jgi:glutamate-ammonia-ligase adenylyltransferase
MKLGPGGLADVEWTVQLLQLRHGAAEPSVRAPGTLQALDALCAAGCVAERDAVVLEQAYRFCARVRNRLYLQAGGPRDSLPTDPAAATRLARSLGYRRHPRSALREEYRRRTRRARRVVDRLLFGDD